MKTIKLSEITPEGNFESILISITKKADEVIKSCHKNKKYDPYLAKYVYYVVNEMDLIEALEEGLEKKDGWSQEQMLSTLLYTHLLLIKLNDTAHKYLNNIEPDPPVKQLNEYIQYRIKDRPLVYGDLQIVE
jgi:hypothetical protein